MSNFSFGLHVRILRQKRPLIPALNGKVDVLERQMTRGVFGAFSNISATN
jgi:hypothetical protein